MSPRQTLTQVAGCTGTDGMVYCRHGKLAVCGTSHTAANPNRRFFRCFLNFDDPNDCKFFRWADDPAFEKASDSGLMMSPVSSPSRPSQRQRAEQARTTMAIPQKRSLSPGASHSPAAAVSPQLSASARRLALIKKALGEDATPLPSPTPRWTQTGAQFSSTLAEEDAAGSTRSALLFSTSGSPAPRSPSPEVDDAIHTLPSDEELLDVPRTPSPKRVRRSYSPDNTADRVGMGLLTPPQTCKVSRRIDDRSKWEEPQTPSRPSRDHSPCAGRSIRTSEEALVYGNLPSFSTSKEDTEWTPDSVTNAIQHLYDIPAYVHKLDRKRRAAEKSAAARGRQIETMTVEFQTERSGYLDRIRVLEDRVKAQDEGIRLLMTSRQK